MLYLIDLVTNVILSDIPASISFLSSMVAFSIYSSKSRCLPRPSKHLESEKFRTKSTDLRLDVGSNISKLPYEKQPGKPETNLNWSEADILGHKLFTSGILLLRVNIH